MPAYSRVCFEHGSALGYCDFPRLGIYTAQGTLWKVTCLSVCATCCRRTGATRAHDVLPAPPMQCLGECPAAGTLTIVNAAAHGFGCMQVLPENRVLRARMISFLHRLVECLGDRLLPSLPAALSALLPLTADAATVSDVCALLSQLAIRYKAALAPLLAEVRQPVHAPSHACEVNWTQIADHMMGRWFVQ